MNETLRARIAAVLDAAGYTGFKDTTTTIRPQWRASFSFSGELFGETSYVHIYVPADADQLQVNCSAQAQALDLVPAERLQDELEKINVSYTPGSAGWVRVLDELGASQADLAGWEITARLYMGMRHRMVLAGIKMPLASLSGSSADLAIKLGLHLARMARGSLATAWGSSQGGEQP